MWKHSNVPDLLEQLVPDISEQPAVHSDLNHQRKYTLSSAYKRKQPSVPARQPCASVIGVDPIFLPKKRRQDALANLPGDTVASSTCVSSMLSERKGSQHE